MQMQNNTADVSNNNDADAVSTAQRDKKKNDNRPQVKVSVADKSSLIDIVLIRQSSTSFKDSRYAKPGEAVLQAGPCKPKILHMFLQSQTIIPSLN